MITITKAQVLAVMPLAKDRVDKFLPYLNRYAIDFNITTPLRWAHYLAQIAHESAELRYTRELASGKAYDTGKLAIKLGNTPQADGDGQKYKGRGLIQITGKANYTKYQLFCEKVAPTITWSVVRTPELLEQPLGATRSSMWFWWSNGLNELADKDDIRAVTKRINGGYNGLNERNKYLIRAKLALHI